MFFHGDDQRGKCQRARSASTRNNKDENVVAFKATMKGRRNQDLQPSDGRTACGRYLYDIHIELVNRKRPFTYAVCTRRNVTTVQISCVIWTATRVKGIRNLTSYVRLMEGRF